MNPYGGSEIKRLGAKLKRHPILGKARVWAWVAPGNVPDPIKLAVLSSRLQKADLILKLSRRNEKIGRALVRRHADPGQKIRIVTDPAAFRKLAARADAWIVYGSDATLEALRRDVPPGVGWIGHGHRISLSVVFASALRRGPAAVAKACVRDIRPYDQRGCLSPQIIWVEGGGAAAFARSLQSTLDRETATCRSIRRDPETHHLRAAVLSELVVRALDPQTLEFARDLDPSGHFEPIVYLLKRGAFMTPAAGQIVAVKGFTSIRDIVKGMNTFHSHIQGIGIAGTTAEERSVRKAFSGTTAVYLTKIGRLQTPPLDWNLG